MTSHKTLHIRDDMKQFGTIPDGFAQGIQYMESISNSVNMVLTRSNWMCDIHTKKHEMILQSL